MSWRMRGLEKVMEVKDKKSGKVMEVGDERSEVMEVEDERSQSHGSGG